MLVPLQGGAVRATTFDFRFDGGGFTMHVYEAREQLEPRKPGAVSNWELVEIARFALSPVAFSRLKTALIPAENMYVAVMGKPPLTDAENSELSMNFVESAVAGTRQPQKK